MGFEKWQDWTERCFNASKPEMFLPKLYSGLLLRISFSRKGKEPKTRKGVKLFWLVSSKLMKVASLMYFNFSLSMF